MSAPSFGKVVQLVNAEIAQLREQLETERAARQQAQRELEALKIKQAHIGADILKATRGIVEITSPVRPQLEAVAALFREARNPVNLTFHDYIAWTKCLESRYSRTGWTVKKESQNLVQVTMDGVVIASYNLLHQQGWVK